MQVIMVGGFLGAGKTTAIGALARTLAARGKRVAVLTNDQAAHLVDTATVRGLGLPVAEVAGGCFCCRFDDFVAAAASVGDADIVLCEPVGSCTDVAATVLNPLRRFQGETTEVAPLTVLAEPGRVREAVLGEGEATLPESVAYIFRKQLEEADLIALSKTDTLTDAEAERLRTELVTRYGHPVLLLSAERGDGLEGWADRLLTEAPTASHGLSEIDYDTYAEGEAVLGWLNATAEVSRHSGETFDADRFLVILVEQAQAAFRAQHAEIAHWKVSVQSQDRTRRAHMTTTDALISYVGELLGETVHLSLTLNARVRIDPEILARSMRDALTAAASEVGATASILTLESFQPSYPRPPHRIPVLA